MANSTDPAVLYGQQVMNDPQLRGMVDQKMQMQQQQAMRQQALQQLQMAAQPMMGQTGNAFMNGLMGNQQNPYLPQQPVAPMMPVQQDISTTPPAQAQGGFTGIPMVDMVIEKLMGQFQANFDAIQKNLESLYSAVYNDEDKSKIDILMERTKNRGGNYVPPPSKQQNAGTNSSQQQPSS